MDDPSNAKLWYLAHFTTYTTSLRNGSTSLVRVLGYNSKYISLQVASACVMGVLQ